MAMRAEIEVQMESLVKVPVVLMLNAGSAG